MRRCIKIVLVFALVAAVCLPILPAGAGPVVEDNLVIHSSDGTPLVAALMLPARASRRHKVPAVLMTHGWGGSRAKTDDATVRALVRRGYAVLTWDSRGFGQSGGEAHVGSPGYEVADAKALIDYLAGRPEIRKDGRRDPRVGWIGVSNAAGVQLNTAALDRRNVIEAIVPVIPWGNLPRDLMPNGVPKLGWDELLYFAGAATASTGGVLSPAGTQTGVYAKEIHISSAQLHATNTISDDIRRWYSFRSTTARAWRIDTPTMIVQGSIDTLFPLEEAFELYRDIKQDAPVKLMSFCGGHTLSGCSYPGGESGYPGNAAGKRAIWFERALDWLDRHVKGKDVGTGPRVEFQYNDGFYRGAPKWPLPGTRVVRGETISGSLVGPGGTGGDGPANGAPAPAPELGSGTALREKVFGPAGRRLLITGIPRVRLKAETHGLLGNLYFELVDVSPGGERVTVDDQTMPLQVGNGASDHRLKLHGISWILEKGHSLELEVTTGSTQYAMPRFGPYHVDLKATTFLPVTRRRVLIRNVTRGV